MRILCITKIFPNALEPLSAPFNRQQFAALGRLADVSVMATIPWFPLARAFAGKTRAAGYHRVPKSDVIAGLPVSHPRYAYLPKVGDGIAAPLYAASLLLPVLARRGRFDVILASWGYPDGVAAVALGQLLGVPVAVKVHGSDLHIIGGRRVVRPWMQWGLSRASRVIAVSRELSDEAVRLGSRHERTTVVRNGIDSQLFSPRSRADARKTLDLPDNEKIILFVGRLERDKGAIDLLRAFSIAFDRQSSVRLVLVGEGGARTECAELTAKLGDRVIFRGARPHTEVADFVAACDVLTLPSWNEGTPNVVLEALASGRRVVATRVGGIPDVVHDERLGELVEPRDPKSLAAALSRAIDTSYDPDEIAKIADVPSWDDSARALHDVLQSML